MKLRIFLVVLMLAFAAGCDSATGAAEDVTTDAADIISDAADIVADAADIVADAADIVAGDTDIVAGDTNVEVVQDAVDDVTDVPEPPHALCGMPAYDLLAPGSVGHLVEFEEIPMLTLDRDTINALLSQFGFEAMSPVPYGSQAYRYRYTTQDRGRLVQATGIMSFPVGADPFTDPLPILLYQHGTSGFSDPCAPSNESNWLEDGALGPAVSALGYVVIAPDYIGMNGFGAPATVRHGYMIGEQTAIGAWDAVRGGLELLDLIPDHPTAQNRVALWGVSQGAHATLFTELWGPWYAPEFEVPAVVAMVPPTDIKALMKQALETVDDPTGLMAVSLVTMNMWYGNQGNLESVFTNSDPYFIADRAPTLMFPEDKCEIDIGIEIDPDTLVLNELFNQNLLDALAADNWAAIAPWDCFYTENTLSTTSVPASRHTPTLMVYGETDNMVVTATQRPDFKKLCSMGYRLDYLECAGAGHAAAALWSMPEQFQFIRDRFAGKPIPDGELCVIRDPVTCSATPAE